MLTIESSNNQSVVYLQSSIVSKFGFYVEKSMAMCRSRHCLFSWMQIYEAWKST